MTKAYTTPEQGKMLAKILPLESADMYLDSTDDGRIYLPKFGKSIAIERNLFSYRNGLVVPCWSLNALFNALPKSPRCEYNLVISEDKPYIAFDSIKLNLHEDYEGEDFVDACVNLIVKFHEEGLL